MLPSARVLQSRCAQLATHARAMSYKADVGRFPTFTPAPSLAGLKPQNERMSDVSIQSEAGWTPEELGTAIQKHSIFAWGASEPLRQACPMAVKGDGSYLVDIDGKRWLDLSSGAVCTNLGNTIPQEIKDAVNDSLDKMGFIYGDLYVGEARARFGKILADIVPGDINGFLFASSGAEANEAAIRMARAYTGRFKVLSRARSYHGGTSTALAATGDPRTWAVSNSSIGMIKMMDPFPFTFEWPSEEERTRISLGALHDQILTEGPNNIACILLESITGANGWMMVSTEYMQGVRALCDKYGILLICDEVMTGFGRTGKLFGFEHYDGVLPDMITFAKGCTSAYMPLSGVGARDHVFDYFRTNPVGYGSTYSGHPLAMAFGEAVVKYTMKHDIVSKVNALAPIMAEEMQRLAAAHPSIKAARSVGLAGGIDLAGKDGNFLMDMHVAHPGVAHIKNKLKEQGAITLVRGHHMHITPPLTISEEDLRKAFVMLDNAFTEQDKYIQSL